MTEEEIQRLALKINMYLVRKQHACSFTDVACKVCRDHGDGVRVVLFTSDSKTLFQQVRTTLAAAQPTSQPNTHQSTLSALCGEKSNMHMTLVCPCAAGLAFCIINTVLQVIPTFRKAFHAT